MTDSAGKVSCVSSSAYITRAFLLRQYASLDQLISTIGGPDCQSTQVSPPSILVPVLSLTQTETSFEQSPARQTSAVGKAVPSRPIIASTVTPTSSTEDKARETSAILPVSPFEESRPSKPNTPPRTSLPVGPSSLPNPNSPSLDQGFTSDKDLTPALSEASPELQPSGVIDQSTAGSKGTLSLNPDDKSGKDSSTGRLIFGGQIKGWPTPTSQLVLSASSGGISANAEGEFITADKTLAPVGSPITASGERISLQSSKAAIVIDGSTVSIQTVPPEPSSSKPPLVSNAAIVIDGVTVKLQKAPVEPKYSTLPIVLPIGSSRITANSEGNIVIGS